MSEEYTPTTEQVRRNHSASPVARFRVDLGEQFDRWLAQHDREVEARAMARAATVAEELRKRWYRTDITPGAMAGEIRDRLDAESIRLAAAP